MTRRLDSLAKRRVDPLLTASGVNEVYERLAEDDAVRYAIGAMQPIDPIYTRNTFSEGGRIQAQLEEAFRTASIGAEFRFQGSVTNDTHIRAHSDIDLLALRTAFEWLEPPQAPLRPYKGNPITDMHEMRAVITARLTSSFPAATIDTSSGKSISITGGSLRRKVDIVPAAWWNTVAYSQIGHERYRGVKVFDATTNSHLPNKPFLHNALIDERDVQSRNAMRKITRLLKSLKADSKTPVEVSSYDIVSIAFRMPDVLLNVPHDGDLMLVVNSEAWLRHLAENEGLRTSLLVPNEMRPIFCDHGCSLGGLQQLHAEVHGLLSDIAAGLARSSRRLEEARVEY